MAEIQLHFEGDIVVDEHKITLRTLRTALDHLQSAIDRAYLDQKYEGGVWKHARLRDDDYAPTEFIVQAPEEGGYIVRFLSAAGNAIVDGLGNAIQRAMEKLAEDGAAEGERIIRQLVDRRGALPPPEGLLQLPTQEDLVENPDPRIVRAYGERSIAKEIDQLLSIVRHKNAGASVISLRLVGTSRRPREFSFNRPEAERFHQVVSRRDLGDPAIFQGRVRSLDSGGYRERFMRGRFTLTSGKPRDINLFIANSDDFDELKPFLNEGDIQIVGAPIIEFGAYDPHGGDVYFVSLIGPVIGE